MVWFSQWRKSVKIIGGDETEPSFLSAQIHSLFQPKNRWSPKKKKKKERSSTKLSQNLRSKSEILTSFFLPKIRCSPKKKKKKKSSTRLSQILRPKSEILTFFLPKFRWCPKVFIYIDSDFSAIILRFLQGTINNFDNFAGYDKLLGGGCIPPHPPLKNYWGDASPHPPRDLRPWVFALNKTDILAICQKVARGKLTKLKKHTDSRKVVKTVTHFTARSYRRIPQLFCKPISPPPHFRSLSN